MLSLMYMAANPNLTAAQFEEQSAKYMEAKRDCWKKIEEALDRIPLEQQGQYLASVLPLMFSW